MSGREIKSFYLTAGGYENIECAVPASVASVFLDKGYLKDPYFADNIKNFAADLPSECRFLASVELSHADAAKKHIYIKLRGIMAKAEFFFNDRSFGLMTNPNRTYIFDVTDRVKVGENILSVKCSAPFIRKRVLADDGNILREYDTPPIIPDMGILEPPVLLMTDSALINNVTVRQEHSGGRVNVVIRTSSLGTEDDIRVVASLTSPSGKIYFGGMSDNEIRIAVPDPELWWPRGFGSPSLYKLSVTLYHGADIADTYEKRIGLRTLEVVKDDNGTPALSVNGIRIYSVGGTYVRENSVFPAVSKTSSDALIASALSKNMNTLTVFDEGIGLSESFYNTCDSKGILIWQSLSVPYIAPPAAGVFAAGLTDSIRDTVIRLSSHPSVALMFLSITESESGGMRLYPDAIDEFRAVTLRIVDPLFEDNASDTVFITDARELFSHDERYLSVSDSRFADSMLYSMPSELTMKTFVTDEEYNLFSKSTEAHIGNFESLAKMLYNISKTQRFPKGNAELTYITELYSADEISRSVKLARMKETRSMSAVLRQLNDGWQTVSSSVRDYYGRAKAPMYFAEDYFAPVTVYTSVCKEKVAFSIINGAKKQFSGKLIYALYDMNNECYSESSREIEVGSGDTLHLEEIDFSKYVSAEKESYFVTYELYDSKGIITKGVSNFVPVKHVAFRDPEIKAEISGSGKRFSIKLSANSYAYAVKVEFDGIDARFNNNFVSLIPGTPTMLTFDTAEVVTLGELNSKLRIISPYNIGK